jgi:hypothetical protein
VALLPTPCIIQKAAEAVTNTHQAPSGIGAAPLDGAGIKGAGRGSRMRVTVLRFLAS